MAKMKITEETLKADFSLFVCYIWSLLSLPQPTPVQLLICKFMSNSKYPRKIIEAFRGVGKSYVAYAFVCWKLWNDPDLKFLIVSASKDRADSFSITCQQFIDLAPVLRHLKPTDRDIVWTRFKWTVNGAKASGSPSVKSAGIESAITGSRADYVIADDVEGVKNSATVDQREKLIRLVSEFEAIKKGDEGDGREAEIMYLGTPQCEESLYNYLSLAGYTTRIWPARYPTQAKLVNYSGRLCPVLEDKLHVNPEIAGTPVDSQRFSHIDLTEREMLYGKSGFALQFMLDTTLSDAERYPLKTSDLVVFNPSDTKAPCQLSHAKTKDSQLKDLPQLGFNSDRWYKPIFVDTEYLEFEGSILAVDPSGRGGDETGYVVIKSLMGYLYVVEAGGLDGGYDDNVLKKLSMIARHHGVQKVIIEANFGDGMFMHLWKPILHSVYPVAMEEVRHNTQKEKRIIDTLEPVMNRHRLIVSSSVIENDYATSYGVRDSQGALKTPYSLFYQLTRITKDRGSISHDDRLDALAMGVAYFTDRMSRDATKELNALKADRHSDWLRKKRAGLNKNEFKPKGYGGRSTKGSSLLRLKGTPNRLRS